MLSETIRQPPATPAFIDISRVVQRKTESLAFMAILKEKKCWFESLDSFLMKCLTEDCHDVTDCYNKLQTF